MVAPTRSRPAPAPAPDRLATQLRALIGPAPTVGVHALGVRDELADEVTGHPLAGVDVPVHVYGRLAVVGPARDTGGTGTGTAPCALCLARRWQQIRPKGLREALELGGPTGRVGADPFVTDHVVTHLAALVRACHASADPDARYPSVFLLDGEKLTVSRFGLMPDPECPTCGRRVADSAAGAVVPLPPSPKRRRRDTRLRDIADYPLDERTLTNPVCGAIGSTVIDELDSPTTSATLGGFTVRKGTHLHEVFWGGHANRYDTSARIGLLEGLERYAGMRPRGRTVEVTAPYTEVRDVAVDPRECGLYSDRFHRNEPRILPYSPDRPLRWVWSWSLRDERARLVPEISVYYHTSTLRHRFVQECSNGCASGGSLVEAVLHGLLELIERDAFLLTWYAAHPLPEIDVRSIVSSSTRSVVDRLELHGYRARFFDARASFSVPVVIGAAERIDGGLGALCFGAGAGLDPEDAIAAALSEIATDAPKLRHRSVRDEDELRAMAADFDRVLALHDHPRLYGLPEMARHADFLLRDRPAPRTVTELYGDSADLQPNDDLTDDLRACVAAMTARGLDVCVVDQTTPEQREIGVHTASVVVPGLLPIDFGWARQRALHLPRLRREPHRLGWVDRELGDADVHRVPHPFP